MEIKPPLPSDAGDAAPASAPGFALRNAEGKPHRLEDYRGRWLVLYFYPKDDTSGCTKQACGFRDDLARFTAADAAVVGVSPDTEMSHARFAGKHQLPFTLLADPEKAACSAYGVWKEKSMYGRKYMGVERTTLLIDPQGRIAKRWAKVKVPGHVAEVLNALGAAISEGRQR